MTAKHVLAAVRSDKYEIKPIGIDRSGSWNRVDLDPTADSLDPAGEAIDPFALLVETARVGLSLIHI